MFPTFLSQGTLLSQGEGFQWPFVSTEVVVGHKLPAMDGCVAHDGGWSSSQQEGKRALGIYILIAFG